MNKQEILDVIKNKDGRIISKRFKESYFRRVGKEDVYQEVLTITNFLPEDSKFSERVFCFLNDISELPLCSCGCQQKTKLVFEQGLHRYQKYFSIKCSANSRDWAASTSKIDYQEADRKRQDTNLKKTGFAFNSQRPEVKKIISESTGNRQLKRLSQVSLAKLNDLEWLKSEYLKGRTSVSLALELENISYGTILTRLKSAGVTIRDTTPISQVDKDLASYIESLGFRVEMSKRGLAPGDQHIDIWVPEKNFGIEYNGFPWHLEVAHDKTPGYHLAKTESVLSKGGTLIHLFPDDLHKKNKQALAFIRSKLGVYTEKVDARKCEVKQISTTIARKFFEDYHLSGFHGGRIKLGLFLGEELVSAVIIGRPRFDRKNYDFELIRFVNKEGILVRGSLGKLTSAFVKQNPTKSLVSYCSRCWSEGNSYLQAGFTKVRTSKPGYHYVDKNYKVFSRDSFQKHKLKKILGSNFNPALSEWENMVANRYDRFWDCGNNVFSINKSPT